MTAGAEDRPAAGRDAGHGPRLSVVLPSRPSGSRPLYRPALVAADLDGTLLSPDGQLVDGTAEGVAALLAAGALFVVSTGRMLQSARRVAASLGILEGPVVCYQGALVSDLATGEWLSHQPLRCDVAAEVVRYAHEHGRHINAFIDDQLVTDQDDEWAARYSSFAGVHVEVVPDLASLVAARAPTKLLVMAHPQQVQECLPQMQQLWRGRLFVTRSLPQHIEVTDIGASKSIALERLRREAAVPASGTVACGDSFNDLDMLRWAALGVAVAESESEVWAAADLVVPRAELGDLFQQLAAAPPA